MNEEEFEELFGNTPFDNIKKIQHYIDKNYIPIQKIKDKIEEIKAKMGKDCIALHEFQREAKIDVLQQLLGKE